MANMEDNAMAGDLEFQESVVFGSVAPQLAAPAPILHQYGKLKIALGGGGGALAPIPEATLTETERFGVSALRLRETPRYKSAKANRRHAAANWGGNGGALALDKPGPHRAGGVAPVGDGRVTPGPQADAPGAPAFRLAGRVAVGLIIVSGPGGLALTKDEQVQIVAEIQNGLSWLGAQSPAKDVTFIHQIDPVSVTAQDNPNGGDYEACERPFRDDALRQLGFAAGAAGISAYNRKLQQNTGANFCYCAFITKYSLFHFAYAQPGATPYLMVNYSNDGWGSDNIDRVFTHESCHIFGAPDEYSVANCNCGGHWGVFGVPNLNCESCAAGGPVDCLMRANSWAMCHATPYHVGFNGLPPFAAPSPAIV